MARSIPDEIVQQVRASASMTQVARHLGYAVTRRGSSLFIVCPFHPDGVRDGGSCILNEGSEHRSGGEPNWFKCFGCGIRGSVFSFWCGHQGWPIEGQWFQRAVREVAAVFGLEDLVPETSGGDDPTARIRQRLEACGRSRVRPTVVRVPETDDDAVCETWTLRRRASEPLPRGLVGRPAALDADSLFGADLEDDPLFYIPLVARGSDVRYPLHAVVVDTLAAACVTEANTGRVRGILIPYDQRERTGAWSVTRNRAELLGRGVDGMVPLVSARLGVESPLDWLRLVRAGYPAVWGVWNAFPEATIDGPLRGAPSMTIPQITALHVSGTGSAQRMRESLRVEQNWIPRELEVETTTLARMSRAQLEAALTAWEDAPVVSLPAPAAELEEAALF